MQKSLSHISDPTTKTEMDIINCYMLKNILRKSERLLTDCLTGSEDGLLANSSPRFQNSSLSELQMQDSVASILACWLLWWAFFNYFSKKGTRKFLETLRRLATAAAMMTVMMMMMTLNYVPPNSQYFYQLLYTRYTVLNIPLHLDVIATGYSIYDILPFPTPHSWQMLLLLLLKIDIRALSLTEQEGGTFSPANYQF